VSDALVPEAPPTPRAAGGGASARSRRAPTVGVLVGLAVVLWGLAIGLRPIDDNSFLTHLATGRLILDHGHIPTHDPYSFTAAGHAFVVQSWLASLLYAVVDRVAGGAGLVLLMGATTALLGALAWRLTRPATDLLARAAAIVPVLVVASAAWSERPLLLGLVFLALVALAADDGLDARWLLPVGWLWVNTHGSWPYGLALVVLLAVGRRLDGARPTVELRALRWLAIGTLAGAVNPLGPRLLLTPLAVLQKSEAFHTVIEWQAPRFDQPWEWGFLATVALVMVALLRGRSWRLALPGIVFTVLALTALRNLPVAGIATLAPLAAGLRGAGTIPTTGRPQAGRVALAALVALGALMVGTAASRDGFALGAYPNDALGFLRDRGTLADPGRRLLAPDAVGNLLELRRGRDARVFFDDRVDMYPEAVTLDYRSLLHPGPDWEDVLDRWGITTILWERDTPLGALVASSPAWAVHWTDDDWLVADRA
jgi:hypothetical protein